MNSKLGQHVKWIKTFSATSLTNNTPPFLTQRHTNSLDFSHMQSSYIQPEWYIPHPNLLTFVTVQSVWRPQSMTKTVWPSAAALLMRWSLCDLYAVSLVSLLLLKVNSKLVHRFLSVTLLFNYQTSKKKNIYFFLASEILYFRVYHTARLLENKNQFNGFHY